MGRDIYCARLAPRLIWVGVTWNTACDFGYEYIYDTVANRSHLLNYVWGWRCDLKDDDDPIGILMQKLFDLEEVACLQVGCQFKIRLRVYTSERTIDENICSHTTGSQDH